MMEQVFNPKMLSEIGKVGANKNFEDSDCSYVLCTEYGTSGLTPTLRQCKRGCISSSGDSLCGGYIGDYKIQGTNLHVVCCLNDLEDCLLDDFNE